MNPSMVNPLFNIEGLIHELEAHNQILVPNRRLARQITSAWGQHCCQQGLQAWRQAPIQTLDTWLLERWQELQNRAYPDCFTHSIINSHAERLIWAQVIDNDSDKPIGIDGSAFARLAQSALQNLERWQVPLAELAQSAHEASQCLLRWHGQFSALLADKQILTPAQAQNFVWQAFQEGFLSKGRRVVLVGFNTEPAPLFQNIIDAAFSETNYWREADHSTAKFICIAANDGDEISQAAQWAKKAIDAQPDQRIGIVFPNLASQRHRIDRVFREIFTPEYCLPSAPHSLPPVNISAGVALSDTALISSALNLLQLQRSPQSLEFYYALLNEPFWGDADNEQIARVQCQLLLRKGYKLKPSSADLRFCMRRAEDGISSSLLKNDQQNAHGTPSLSQALQQFEDRCRRQGIHAGPETGSTKKNFSFWAEEFSRRLKILGWPGTRILDSIEYQQQQLWIDVLEEFAGLDSAIDPVDNHSALTQLARICRDRIFQAEGSDSPVQVLGLLEAAGLHFDSLWLAEMHDGQWPQSPDYNPLLPAALQKLHKMPRSSTETELRIARQLLKDFENHCPQIVFSYGSRDGDSERQISRLLDGDFANLDAYPSAYHPLLWDTEKPPLQKVAIDQAPPLPGEKKPIRGGSAILRDQARCPFNAFATWRLGAEALPEPTFGFTAIERGNLVHHALELFWADCQDSSTLNNMDSAARDTLLAQSIDTAISQARTDRPDLFGPRFFTIESQRLNTLLSSWLDIERSRGTFSVVGREETVTFHLGELNMSLRIDRIDKLEDGSVMLIDYKTGSASIKGFADERPEEPQLLLYALAIDQSLSSLCFAQISASKGVGLKGLTSQVNMAPDLSDLQSAGLEGNWTDTLALWRQRLQTLAAEFCQGNAEMVFYSNTAVTYQSHLLPLNRWPEIGASNGTEVNLERDLATGDIDD